MDMAYILSLLKQSADKLQDYRSESDGGDYNDGLAMEIYRYLDKIEKGA